MFENHPKDENKGPLSFLCGLFKTHWLRGLFLHKVCGQTILLLNSAFSWIWIRNLPPQLSLKGYSPHWRLSSCRNHEVDVNGSSAGPPVSAGRSLPPLSFLQQSTKTLLLSSRFCCRISLYPGPHFFFSFCPHPTSLCSVLGPKVYWMWTLLLWFVSWTVSPALSTVQM